MEGKEMNRREFIKTVGYVAGALAFMLVGSDSTTKAKDTQEATVKQQHDDDERHIYMAEFGWLEGREFNNIIFTDEAIRQTLELLDGAPIYSDFEKKERVGAMASSGSGKLVFVARANQVEGRFPGIAGLGVARGLNPSLVDAVNEVSICFYDHDNDCKLWRLCGPGPSGIGGCVWARCDGAVRRNDLQRLRS
jgi:hypothetical protein